MNEKCVVYLVEDDPILSRALARLLQVEGLAVQAFLSAEEFLLAHEPSRPGCAVIDVRLPQRDGLAVQQALLAAGGERAVVLMSGYDDVAAGVNAMKAGALDFLVKPFEDEVFLAAVRCALEADRKARLVRDQLQSVRGRLATLTPREHQVLEHVVVGRLNKQIAADLGITEKTIKVHRARAMEKMGVGTLAELVRKTLEIEVGTVVGDGGLIDGRPVL
ncbi:response regulator transcription factor [Massilia horti]|uniref:Response regulator transcription factor n=1 Tax=Massilia horti TaxID=2562153 RepID=A0A4Y9T2C5_9BURK|nr:response regulator [Massilia horti]TFW31184.1 response regulator transcription factor [Massilia horti]